MGKNPGFTIIELLLVILIISVISFISVPFYGRLLNQNAVANTADQIAGSLRKAQLYSMMGKQNTTWGVSYGAGNLQLFATGKPAFNENFEVNPAVAISGLTSVTFSRVNGIPDATATITVSQGTNNRTITINGAGVVSK